MPATINGIGTGYWGKKNVLNVRSQCQNCQNVTDLKSYDTWYCFVVLFLPVIPLQKKRILNQCSRCSSHHQVSLKKWEKSKQQATEETLEAFQADPQNPETGMDYLSVLIEFQDKLTFQRTASLISDRFQDNADIHQIAAQGYAYFGDIAMEMNHRQMVFNLEPTPQNRRNLAYTSMLAGQLERAESLLSEDLKQGENEPAGYFYLLVQAYQSQGNHVKALEILDKVVATWPEIASQKDWLKLRKISVKNEGGRKAIKSDWMNQNQRKKKGSMWIPLVISTFILFAAGFGIFRLTKFQKIHIYNATHFTYDLEVNGKKMALFPGRTKSKSIPKGEVSFVYHAPGGEEIPFKERIDDQVFKENTIIINPDQTGVFFFTELLYSQDHYQVKDEETDSLAEETIVGQRIIRKPKVDFLFKSSPPRIDMEKLKEIKSEFRIAENLPIDSFKNDISEEDFQKHLDARLALPWFDEEAMYYASYFFETSEFDAVIKSKVEAGIDPLECATYYQEVEEKPQFITQIEKEHPHFFKYLASKDTQESLALLNQSSGNENKTICTALARLELGLGNAESMSDWISKGQRLSPNSHQIKDLKDLALALRGNYKVLQNREMNSVRRNPKNVQGYFNALEFGIKAGENGFLVLDSLQPQLNELVITRQEAKSIFTSHILYYQLKDGWLKEEDLSFEGRLANGKFDITAEEKMTYPLLSELLKLVWAKHHGRQDIENATLASIFPDMFPMDGAIWLPMIRGESPTDLAHNLSLHPTYKSLVYLYLGQIHEEQRPDLFELAQKINIASGMPYYTVGTLSKI